MTDTLQLQPLIPVEVPNQSFITVSLYNLPPNEELVGDPPSATFVKNIKNYGVQQPILLKHATPEYRERTKITYVVVDGRRRVKAARLCGHLEINAVVTLGEVTPEILSLSANTHRSSNKVSDLLATESLLDQGYSKEDISLGGSFSTAKIKAALHLRALLPALKDLLFAGSISSSLAGELASFSVDLQREALALYQKEGKLTTKDVKQLRMVKREAVLESLFDLPSGPTNGFTGEEMWTSKTKRHIDHALDLVPVGEQYNTLVTSLLDIKEMIERIQHY